MNGIYIHDMRINEKNIENRMIEWRDESDEIEDDKRMVKNEKIE